MNRTITAFIIVLLLAVQVSAETNPVCNLSLDQAETRIKEKLLVRYPNQFSLIKMLLDTNVEAYQKICRIPNSEPHHSILAALNKKYQYDFSLILMLYENNIKAYQDLNR